MDSSTRRPLIFWLDATVAAVALAVVVGGITRLTESGLSITEWKPIAGMLPPMNAAEWDAAYQRFLLIPQAQTIHAGITLPAFRGIFWWEWIHRQVARMVGLVIALPYFWFLVRRQIPSAYRLRLMALPLLVAAQGAMGWYMVSSGLSVRSNVSQYRLVAYLGLALVILVVALWTSASLRADSKDAERPDSAARRQATPEGARWATVTMLFALWSFGVILTGGFVAGLRAGKIYNTFPLMGGQVVPPGYWQVQGFLVNAFENPAAAQFHHRVLAIVTVLAAIAMWFAAVRRLEPAAVVRAQGRVAVAATLQVALGIATLLLSVPVAVAALHQLVAVALLGTAVLAAHTARRS